MPADVRAIARRWFEEVWNQRRDAAVDELMSDQSLGHVEGGVVQGRAGFRKMRDMFFAAVPDLNIAIEDILAEGERAAVRWRVTGTHAGDGFGFPATQRRVDQRGTTWVIVRNGQLVEGWDTWNLHGMLKTLQEAPDAEPAKIF